MGRNSFSRRSLQTVQSMQNFSSIAATSAASDAFVFATSACNSSDNSVSGADSEFSEYDLVNEDMQEFLLGSCGSSSDEEEALPYGMDLRWMTRAAPLFPTSQRATLPSPCGRLFSRRRMAKKSSFLGAASSTGASRMSPSSSTTLLCETEVAQPTKDRRARPAARDIAKVRRSSKPRHLLPPLQQPSAATGADCSSSFPLFSVVLDLDETLVCARDGPISIRPYAKDLLQLLHRIGAEVIIWTAGKASYVNGILREIGHLYGHPQWFHHVISRHRCWYRGDGNCAKDLALLGRPLDRVVMVENNPICVAAQPSHAILVEDFLCPNEADDSLKLLGDVLHRIAFAFQSCRIASALGPPMDGGASGTPVVAVSPTTVATLLSTDTALVPLRFRVGDICGDGGLTAVEQSRVREAIGPIATLSCLGLRSTSNSLKMEQRSYGCIRPWMEDF